MAAVKATTTRFPWFVRGDVDGFFGLFVDNLLQLMLIAVLCEHLCGMPASLVYGRILPGAALSILAGNVFYAWQAKRLAERDGRRDRTALPYGINTVSLLAYVLLIMAPVYRETRSPELAWRIGLIACVGSGLMECLGAFVGDWLRRHTPRAALLSTLAGIALTFISMGFVFQIFASPEVALLPMLVVIAAYASRVRLPWGVPGGFVAVAIGVATAWVLRAFGVESFQAPNAPYQFTVHPPIPSIADIVSFLVDERGLRYFSVIFPMGLFNVIGSLQNLESAEAAGDVYPTRPSLLANGIGTLVAASFGSPFPTTIYIGHPAWKTMGARWGYSVLNGAVIALLCLVGGVTLVLRIVPLEATLGILLWIGITITAQAFQEVPKQHGLAVALGLIPSLASWAQVLIETALAKAGTGLAATAAAFGGDLYIHGVLALSQGFMLSSMTLSAILVFAIERDFRKAAIWSCAAAGLAFFGLIHAYRVGPGGAESFLAWAAAPRFAVAYAGAAVAFVLLHLHQRNVLAKDSAASTVKSAAESGESRTSAVRGDPS